MDFASSQTCLYYCHQNINGNNLTMLDMTYNGAYNSIMSWSHITSENQPYRTWSLYSLLNNKNGTRKLHIHFRNRSLFNIFCFTRGSHRDLPWMVEPQGSTDQF